MKIRTPHQAAEVHYTLEILDASGRVARRLPRKRNLILDQGLDGIAARSWVNAFTHAAVGTGTTPTKRDSGAITFARAGNTITASAAFFEAADVGRLLKFDSGEEVRITAFLDATTVTTSDAGTIAASEGTIWYVNQTGLAAEVKRTGTYSADSGANGSSFLAGVWTHKRTFIFAAESGTVTYREIGWSHTATAGANLFGRDLLAGAGVTLVATQQLRVIVELSVAYSPNTPSAYTNVVTGWTQDGAHGITFSDLNTVNANGTTNGTATGTGNALEPSVTPKRCILSDSFATIGAMSGSRGGAGASGTNLGSVNAVGGSYASGSFRRDFTATFGVNDANSSSIRSIWFGQTATSSEDGRMPYRVLLDAAEAKTSSQTLTLVFSLSWGRVLNNA